MLTCLHTEVMTAAYEQKERQAFSNNSVKMTPRMTNSNKRLDSDLYV